MIEHRSPIGLVLSGGGARGAYEAGVLAGIHEIAGERLSFDVVTGTSVGAINAVHVAGHAEREDRGIQNLVNLWTALRVDIHLRPHIGRLFGWRKQGDQHWGRSLLDPTPFEEIVENAIPWAGLHENVRSGIVKAVIVSALNVANGNTHSFVEMTPGRTYVPSHDPTVSARGAMLTPDHVLASAAIPLLFTARRVGDSYYCDGGLRFNTPIAPAIRAGAERLLVVALRARRVAKADQLDEYPNPIFLLGKIFDALLLDPIDHDLQMLERLNRMFAVLESEVGPQALAHVSNVLKADRGLPYRRVQTLVFRPSEDIGVLALEHLRTHRARLCHPDRLASVLLENLAALGSHVEADVLSYLLFDGEFSRTLIDLGRRNVQARRTEVESFFDGDMPS